MNNENLPGPDFEFDNEDENYIIGYECLTCGNVQSTSFDCNRCAAFTMEPIFE